MCLTTSEGWFSQLLEEIGLSLMVLELGKKDRELLW
jgi:hypothetical protein